MVACRYEISLTMLNSTSHLGRNLSSTRRKSMKIICVLFIPKLRFRHSYYSEKLQHFLIDSNFFQAVTVHFILNNKQEQEINY